MTCVNTPTLRSIFGDAAADEVLAAPIDGNTCHIDLPLGDDLPAPRCCIVGALIAHRLFTARGIAQYRSWPSYGEAESDAEIALNRSLHPAEATLLRTTMNAWDRAIRTARRLHVRGPQVADALHRRREQMLAREVR